MSKNSYNKKPKRGKYTVIVLNDEHNTFEHVTKCLQEVCGHNKLQATNINRQNKTEQNSTYPLSNMRAWHLL